VTWATCNVDAPGQFADKPEDTGLFYLWNSKNSLPTTGIISPWDPITPAGTTWASGNDPCPAGWRVPTSAEAESLFAANVTKTVGQKGDPPNEWPVHGK